MVPCHTASPVVQLRVKQTVRLYVIVCLPVVFRGPGLLVAVVGPLSCPFSSLGTLRSLPPLYAVAAVARAFLWRYSATRGPVPHCYL